MKSFIKFLRIFSLSVLMLAIISPSLPVQAAIEATDYFTITPVAGVSVDAGGSLTFTIASKDSAGAANPLTGADHAFVEILDSTSFGSSDADITAIGGNMALKPSVITPWGDTTPADITGTNDTLIAVNFSGDSSGTLTVKANSSSFEIVVWAQGAAINAQDAGGDWNDGGTPPGQDIQRITVNAATTGADHLVASFGSTTTAEINEQKTVTVNQVNTGGGMVTSALTDAVIDVNAVSVTSGVLSSTIESSADTTLGSGNGIVKFTSAKNTTAYYMVSLLSNSTFKVMGADANVIYSNSNIIEATGLSAGGQQAAIDIGPDVTVTKDTATVIPIQATTTLTAGNIVSIEGPTCSTRGYFSVTSVTNDAAASTVTVMGHTNGFDNCAALAGGAINLVNVTATGDPSVYTVSDGVGAEGYIYSVGGVATGNTTTTVVTGKTLTAGTISAVVVPTEEGAFTVTPSSPTLAGASVTDAITAGAATDMTIQAYGPTTGQTGVPTMAPVDFFFNKNPSTSVTFPLINATDSTFSITTGGTAVPGFWNYFIQGFGSSTLYGVTFAPTSPFLSSTSYTASVTKAFATSKGTTNLVDGGTAWTSTFTTGDGGGAFVAGGGFTGDMGGVFPPIAMMGYPMPGQWEVPTNIGCVTVDFDRPMTATDLTTSNIYIKKVVSGALSGTLPAGTPVVTAIGDNNDSVCVSGYTYEASSEYCVVVENDITSAEGDSLAGMPGSSGDGCGGTGMGFGFSNMGPFEESFHTGTGSQTITVSMMGTNLDLYKSGSSTTNVPVGFIPRVTFNGPLNPTTLNATNITLKKNGTVNTAGSIYYDPMDNAIEFVSDEALSSTTSYTLNISSGVTSISGTAITAITRSFTTGAADSTNPRVVFADADNYGISVQFDEPLNKATAENKAFYTVKTCTGAAIAADGGSCTGGGSVTTISLLSGVNIHYEREDNSVWMDGMTLTPGDGFYVGLSVAVTDVAGIGFHATDNKSWTGTVMDGSKFGGGQGMFQQDTMGLEDFNMKNMGMMPIGAWPMNSMANMTTLYFLDIPLTVAIPADGFIELTFPTGTVVSGVLQDQYSPMNSDFNGPGPGSPTFKAGITSSVSTDTASSGAGTLDDGIGYISAARKVYIQLSATTQASDFLHIDIAGIKNPSEPKSFDTSGYSVEIRTFNFSGTLLESMTTMPYFISEGGTNTISGQITAGGVGVNGVRVFLDSWSAGFQETTTANDGAGTLVAGTLNGEYKFENLPDGDYHLFIESSDSYSEIESNLGYINSATTKDMTLTVLNGTNCATLPVSISIAGIENLTSLGASDSVDIFGRNTTGQGGFVKTLTRTQVIDSASTPIDLFLCNAGMYNVGIRPALPKGEFSMFPKMEWMPPQNQNVNVLTSNIGGPDMSVVTFATSAPDATIAGVVKDSAGTALSGGKVFADFSAGGFGGDSNIGTDGTFSLSVSKGKIYRVGAFLPGILPDQDHFVKIDNSGNVYVDGSTTVSTGSSGANPFVITMAFNSTTSLTVSGRVSDGTNAIAGAGIWAHRTDAQRPPVNGFTDSSGNYILYIPEAGTWQVEANAPGLGFLGSKTLTVTTDNFTEQNFEPLSASLMGTIAGDIEVPGTTDDSGVVVSAYNPDGYFNMAITESDGTYTMDVRIDPDPYTVEVWSSTLGYLANETQVVDGNETLSPASVGTPRELTVTLEEAVSDDTFLNFMSTAGTGTEIKIPEGETSATVSVPEGDYWVDFDLPFDEAGTSLWGAEFNSTTDAVNIDGTGDDITITLPDLNTVSGTIADGGATGVEGAIVTITDESTNDTFIVVADSSGNYTFKAPDGTYSMSAEQSGFVSIPEDITVTTNAPGQNFTLNAADKTITGTITSSTGAPVEGAFVYATMAGGGMATSETNASGVYTMNVSRGIWDVDAVTDGYSASATSLSVNTSSTNVTAANIRLPATTVALDDPAVTSVSSSSSTSFSDADLDVDINLPPNSVDADSTLNFSETNELPVTRSADPFSTGIDITGTTTNDGTPVTSFDNDVDLTFEYTVAELATEGVDTPTETDQLAVGYLNESTDNWTIMPTLTTYHDSIGRVIPYSTIDDYATLAAASTGADLTTITLRTSTDHLTTFAPIVSSGATPPATPSGLTAVAGDGQVVLTWTKNSEADMSRYDIWEANITEGILTTLTQAACTVTPCTKTVTGLTNGTAYSFQILAVDTDGNSSAGSTAETVTPVASGSSTPGGGSPLGGGGGSSGSSSDDSDEEEEEEVVVEEQVDLELSTLAEIIYAEPYTVVEGVIAENMSLMAEGEIAAATFEADTKVTTADGEPYSGEISPPTIVEGDIVQPKGFMVLGDVYEVGPSEKELQFDKSVTLRFPLPEGASANDEVSVHYFNEATGEWTDVGGEIKELEDGSLVIEVSVDHFTKFVVMEEEAEVIEEAIFEDTVDHWAKEFIEDLYNQGIVSGYDETHYGPDNNISRAEFTKIAIEAFSIPTLNSSEVTFMPFKDVETDEWYATYIQAAYVWDIVTGYKDGTFKPNQSINRAEAMRILFDAAKIDVATSYDAGFEDVDSAEWYAPYINYAAEQGIVSGYEDGTFGPSNNLKRGEVAKIVSLLLKSYIENAEGVVGMVLNMAM